MTSTVILALAAVGILMLIASAALSRQARHAREDRPMDLEATRVAVLAAVDRDDLTEAVRIYRRDTGARLLEASNAVEHIALNRR